MKAGLGIRPELFDDVFDLMPNMGFFEAHSENYFGESMSTLKLLELREHYPLSLHGVGLSLGRADDLDNRHLQQLKTLVDRIDPMLVSEHLAWSAYAHRQVPDLLPLPLTEQALNVMCEHVSQMQDFLKRQILVENPSHYLLFDQLQIPEPEFLNTLAQRTGCLLLIDVNNIHVSATNLQRDAQAYIQQLNSSYIGQYHLAGYTSVESSVENKGETLLIDTHNQPVYPEVWHLFKQTLAWHGTRPTLIEWDADFPDFNVLLQECEKADEILQNAVEPLPSQVTAMQNNEAVLRTDSLEDLQQDFLDSTLKLQKQTRLANQAHRQRIWVYQNNVYNALLDYLAEVYPAVKGVLGEGYFKQLVIDFVQKQPPNDGNIHDYGASFSTILTDKKALSKVPYLTDLIGYEWVLHRAYYDAKKDVVDPRTLAQEALLVTPLKLKNEVSLISSDYPIYEIHRQSLPNYQAEVAINLQQSQDKLLVYKKHNKVTSRLLSADEFTLLSAIPNSQNLLQVIESLEGSIEPKMLSSILAFVFDVQLLEVIA